MAIWSVRCHVKFINLNLLNETNCKCNSSRWNKNILIILNGSRVNIKVGLFIFRGQGDITLNVSLDCVQLLCLRPHRCPDPQHKNTAPCNFTTRLLRRSVSIKHDVSQCLSREARGICLMSSLMKICCRFILENSAVWCQPWHAGSSQKYCFLMLQSKLFLLKNNRM